MKILHLLYLVGTAFTLTHAADYKKQATVLLSTFASIKNDVTLFGKHSSEGLWLAQTAYHSPHGNKPYCPEILDPITGACPGPEFFQVGNWTFDRPTTDPRPVSIWFAEYHLECNLTMNQDMDGRFVVWQVHHSWGLQGDHSDFKIECNNATAYYSEYDTSESGLPTISA